MPSNILVIPDYHALPGVDNKRASVLGRHICEWKPDVVVCLGDWWDMQSICKWSKKFELEGKRYKDDLEVGHEAMELMFKPIRAAKKKLPRFVFTMGNHEQRVFDLPAELPVYSGIIGPEDFDLDHYGWETVGFKEDIEIEGWLFSHWFPSGLLGKPIGGKNVGATMVRELKTSAVQGHNHIFDWKRDPTQAGRPIHGITAGCFVHPTNVEAWNRNVRKKYALGVLHLTNAAQGDASVSFVRMQDL